MSGAGPRNKLKRGQRRAAPASEVYPSRYPNANFIDLILPYQRHHLLCRLVRWSSSYRFSRRRGVTGAGSQSSVPASSSSSLDPPSPPASGISSALNERGNTRGGVQRYGREREGPRRRTGHGQGGGRSWKRLDLVGRERREGRIFILGVEGWCVWVCQGTKGRKASSIRGCSSDLTVRLLSLDRLPRPPRPPCTTRTLKRLQLSPPFRPSSQLQTAAAAFLPSTEALSYSSSTSASRARIPPDVESPFRGFVAAGGD
jgi:hypothetical protein